MPVYFPSVITMSSFQVSVTANADDIDGSFRTSLRSSGDWRPVRPKSGTRERSSSGTRNHSTTTSGRGGGPPPRSESVLGGGNQSINRTGSYRDSAFDSLDSFRSSSFTSGPSRNRASQRQSRSSQQQHTSRSRSRTGHRGGGYDATIYNDAPLVSRYNETGGELYQPVSYAWQAFKERLFDSSLSEKYETLQVGETPRNNRRYRSQSVNSGYIDDDDDDDPYSDAPPNAKKKLLFLQDPLARSMYRNLETFFDRKNLIRDAAAPGDLFSTSSSNNGGATSRSFNNFSRQQSSSHFGGEFEQRPQSSMDFRSASSQQTARGSHHDPPRSHSSLDNRNSSSSSGSGSFFGRRKKEQPPASARSHSADRADPHAARREIQQRFAKINFEEGTTDYDALFTVTEEGAADAAGSRENSDGQANMAKSEHGDVHHGGGHLQGTPKAKLDHLRY
ncbi:hypothetical protein BV898_16355 [Hypsibius exemplaris]|uniref:Uncharacterized protein n=1 Tax=Hypsibius exemplaris TaxID=2072580 RepID=A0A9X6NLT5_HYPEX|nr:hypothetical protein BV898_16355 [Hypsibius exemplaris]